MRIQAQTIWPATPQRTAVRRRSEPTPMMEPDMVCVVLTGMPNQDEKKRVAAAAVSAQNPSTGRSLVTFWPRVLTMRQPPNMVQRYGRLTAQHDPQRNVEFFSEKTRTEKKARDDSHGFLCVIAAVAQAVQCRRQQLALSEKLVHLCWS